MSLDNEDKQWIVSAIRSGIAESEARLTARIAESESRLNVKITQEIAESESRTNASLERVETNLLAEFHKWASPLEQRMRTHREALRALDLELDDHRERLARLEPPH